MSFNKDKEIDSESIKIDGFLEERLNLRQINLKYNALFYSMDYCIKNFEKIGLTEAEKECIKNRAYTYFLYYKFFNTYQKDNFPTFLKKENL